MLRDWKQELEDRAKFVKDCLADAHCNAIVYGNSGGKDCSLVSIICSHACDDVLGVVMPCASKRNYGADKTDALECAKQFNIKQVTVDLTETRQKLIEQMQAAQTLTDAAVSNIAPRLRMTTLYALAQSRNALVAGTGNASERYMGYFTKWGDGACDFNPIADLTVEEIYDFLRYLGAPQSIINKAPSAGLFEGQTDEGEMGVTYAEIDSYIKGGAVSEKSKKIIDGYHSRTAHKRTMPKTYKGV